MYEIVTDFFIMTLYLPVLLNSLISSNNSLVDFLGFSRYDIMSSVAMDSFTSSFLLEIHFISFPCSLLTRISSAMLNICGESVRHCVPPDLRRNAQLLSVILTVGVLLVVNCSCPLLCWRKSLLFLLYSAIFFMNYLFFCIYWYDHMFFCPFFY